jgi:hypothetical protein
LLLTYYRPPADVDVYAAPQAAPPGFSEAVDIPRLEEILGNHERIWVSYGAIHWADPLYSVSRWLAENANCVFERDGMSLCLRPSANLVQTYGGADLGSLTLRSAQVDRQSAQMGDAIQVRLDLEGQDLDGSIGVELGLLDASGYVWTERSTSLGPTHSPAGSALPSHWQELTGLWLLPGPPPGQYRLGLRLSGDGIDSAGASDQHGWIDLGPLTIVPGSSQPSLVQLLPNHGSVAPDDDEQDLNVVGLRPYAGDVMQGYPAGFWLWWQPMTRVDPQRLEVRLAGRSSVPVGTFDLGPAFYPVTRWQPGQVIRQEVFFQVPTDLPAGTYEVMARLRSSLDDAEAEAADTGLQPSAWLDLFELTVEGRTHRYSVPLLMRRREAQFSDLFALRGVRLSMADLSQDGDAPLTVYWQALRAPDQVYAAFNHLRAEDGEIVWHQDSWPQAGVYTTERWLEGEIVAETYTVRLPGDLEPGTYTLYTGIYDPSTGTRLPAYDDKGQRLQHDQYALLQIPIRE